jgi:hypothetical protein
MTVLKFLTAGVRIDLNCPDPDVAAIVGEVGAAMLTTSDAPAATVLDLDSLMTQRQPHGWGTDQCAATALSAVDRAALDRNDCLVVHAAAVSGPRGCVVLPGASGSGKTTLAAASMQLGLSLISDEAACIKADSALLAPHPRPLGLSLASRELLGVATADDEDVEMATAPTLFGRSVPTSDYPRMVLVAIPDRRVGAEPALLEVMPSAGLASLLGNCLNASLDGRGGTWRSAAAWRLLTELTTQVKVGRLVYDNPYDGASLLRRALSNRS